MFEYFQSLDGFRKASFALGLGGKFGPLLYLVKCYIDNKKG